MKGTIRVMAGLVVTMFGVGGVEHSMTNADMLMAAGVALAGIAILAWGAAAINSEVNERLQ